MQTRAVKWEIAIWFKYLLLRVIGAHRLKQALTIWLKVFRQHAVKAPQMTQDWKRQGQLQTCTLDNIKNNYIKWIEWP